LFIFFLTYRVHLSTDSVYLFEGLLRLSAHTGTIYIARRVIFVTDDASRETKFAIHYTCTRSQKIREDRTLR